MRDRSGRGLRAVRWGLVLAVLVPVAAAIALWIWQHDRLSDLEASDAEDRAVVDAATRTTLVWAAVDHTKVDEYFKAVEANSTGAFLEQFTGLEKTIRVMFQRAQPVQVPTIPKDGVGILEHKPGSDTATVLLALDATLDNTSTHGPQPRQFRLRLTMTQVDDEWRISGMEYIDAES